MTAGASSNPDPITHESLVATLKQARELIGQIDHDLTSWGYPDGDPLPGRINAVLASLDACIVGCTRANPDANGFFWWLFTVGVCPGMVADGVDFTDRRLHEIFRKALPFVYGRELKAKVLGRPSDDNVASAQGFDNVADYREARGEP